MERLLVVEDSNFFLNLIVRGFEGEQGIDLVVARNYLDAASRLKETPGQFALALVDLRLPDAVDGEAIDLALKYNVPVVVFTSNFDESVREHFLGKGVLDFVLKDNPSSLDYLLKLTRRVIKNRATTALVVDDSNVALRLCSDLLKRYQLNVIEAKSGTEALTILRSTPDIRLVITDHEMPEMNGFDLATTIRREHGRDKLAIIGVSGSGGAPLSARFLKHGANDFIAKPYLPEELYTRVAINLDMLDNIDALTTAATTDPLTGLPNRRSFFDTGKRIAATRRRSRVGCAVAILDVDHFKKVNDTYGHDAGDAVLRSVAETIRQHAGRGGDLCARLGGEEFAMLLEVENPGRVGPYFDTLRAAIEGLVVRAGSAEISVTASFGVVIGEQAELELMMAAADKNLYKAKADGRNCMVVG